MDYLKEQVVKAVFDQVKLVDGYSIRNIYEGSPTIDVLTQVENLRLLLKVKTPAGPRFFMVSVRETY